MKSKILVSLFCVMSLCGVAFAEDGVVENVTNDLKGSGTYGAAGCGLGSMLFQKNTKVQQVLAATTNGTFGSQTFGISSGTSNCTSQGLSMIEKEKEIFVEVNYATLQKEIAQANGETLASFATLMGCSSAAHNQFAKTLQKNTTELNKISNGTEFIQAVEATVKSDSDLAPLCGLNS